MTRTSLVAVLTGLLLLPGVAGAATQAVTVSPTSGGPGIRMTIAGSGFCARPACGPVRISMSGRQVAVDQRPDAAGRFRTTTQAPGGLTPGEHDVVARQVLDDGSEISATASFVYSPSKGEAAEQEAENRDAVGNLVNPSNPTPSPRGQPFGAAAGLSSATPAGSPSPLGDLSRTFVEGSDGGVAPAALAAVAAAVIAVLVTGGLMWRRRRLGGDS